MRLYLSYSSMLTPHMSFYWIDGLHPMVRDGESRGNAASHPTLRPSALPPCALKRGQTQSSIFGLNAKHHTWMKPSSIPTVKHGCGSIMLWGCFSVAGTGRLVRIDGKMNRAKYREVLDENLLQSAQDFRLGGEDSPFLQANDPKNTAKTTQKWLRDKSLNVHEWPSQSPDLNLIEHLWRDLKIAVQRHSPSNLTELERICTKYRCAELVASYPRRRKAVIAAKGASTKY
uniref:Tc1-like transposase DDE domain-containing protein n=1 Tax=Oncorhynchus tshawytscha TaxID=74940 RepID=A0AAZ3QMZ1_ONCTS